MYIKIFFFRFFWGSNVVGNIWDNESIKLNKVYNKCMDVTHLHVYLAAGFVDSATSQTTAWHPVMKA